MIGLLFIRNKEFLSTIDLVLIIYWSSNLGLLEIWLIILFLKMGNLKRINSSLVQKANRLFHYLEVWFRTRSTTGVQKVNVYFVSVLTSAQIPKGGWLKRVKGEDDHKQNGWIL